MPPTVRASTQDLDTGTVANHTATIPGTAATGDLVVIAISTNGGTLTVPPAGWTTVESEFTQANPRYAIIYRVRQVGDPSTVVITTTGVTSTSITAVIQPGPGGTLALDGTPTKGTGATGSATMTCAAVTTTVANTLLVYGQAVNSSTNAQSPPAGMTEQQETTGTKKQALSTEAFAATGSTGTRAGASAANNLAWAAILFAVKSTGETAVASSQSWFM